MAEETKEVRKTVGGVMNSIPMPFNVVCNGVTWSLYSIDFDTADGKFSTYIYALSMEHAVAICAELRESARVSGQVVYGEKA